MLDSNDESLENVKNKVKENKHSQDCMFHYTKNIKTFINISYN